MNEPEASASFWQTFQNVKGAILALFHQLKLKYQKHIFLFEELVKRDFKQKYKRTMLGMGWSILSPLLSLLVLKLVFTQFFGRTMNHYATYLFAGNLLFSFFR